MWSGIHEEAAAALAAAERDRVPTAPLTRTWPGLTVDDAYEIQRFNVAHRTAPHRVAVGERVVGHKVDLTSRAMQEMIGVDQPDFGHLLDGMVVEGQVEAAGVPVIEVAHGDGLGGCSYVYGRSGTDELTLIRAAVEEARQARIAALMPPGVGTTDDIKAVHDLGVSVIRVARHCSEADISEQHFGLARDMGLETVGFLMFAHRLSPEELAKQARIMVDAGCQCVYVTDSAGAMILEDVTDRVEALVAVCDKLGLKTGIDTFAMMRVAEEIVRPIMSQECVVDRLSLAMGYGGVYSSFMKHATRAAERYGMGPGRDPVALR